MDKVEIRAPISGIITYTDPASHAVTANQQFASVSTNYTALQKRNLENEIRISRDIHSMSFGRLREIQIQKMENEESVARSYNEYLQSVFELYREKETTGDADFNRLDLMQVRSEAVEAKKRLDAATLRLEEFRLDTQIDERQSELNISRLDAKLSLFQELGDDAALLSPSAGRIVPAFPQGSLVTAGIEVATLLIEGQHAS